MKNKNNLVKFSPKKLRSSITVIESTPVSIDLTSIEDIAKVTDPIKIESTSPKEELKEDLSTLLDITQVKRGTYFPLNNVFFCLGLNETKIAGQGIYNKLIKTKNNFK